MASHHSLLLFLFWFPLALLVYTTAIYPCVIALWARLRPCPVRRDPIEPSVSIVIAAHNEEMHIGAKIKNLLSIDYPPDRMEILVGSDGSTDGTLERLRAATKQHIRVFIQDERQGKPAMLNKLVPHARGEIVVLADVRQQFDPQVLRKIVLPFADPVIGAVSGEIVLSSDCSSVIGAGVGKYWQYEKFIRARESEIDSTVGATGAIYAIRKKLFEPIPADTILDDVLIPLRIVRQGYRVLLEPDARACDAPPHSARQEFTRKVRTLAGNFQLFSRERWLLNPSQNRIWWQTISHKLLRLLFPLLQASAFGANVALARNSLVYEISLLAQVLFYVAAVAGSLSQHARKKFWPVTLSYTFCLMSWATVVGFTRCVTGRQAIAWEKALQ